MVGGGAWASHCGASLAAEHRLQGIRSLAVAARGL